MGSHPYRSKTTTRGAEVTATADAPYAEFVDEFVEEWDESVRRLSDRIQRAWRGVR